MTLLVDQLTKTWALNALDDGPIHVIGTLRFALSFNSGATFGIGKGLTPFVMAAAAVLVVVLIGVGRGTSGALGLVAIGLITGGALGNLTDRLIRDHDGAVIDFVDLRWWPVFNVADAGIVIGSALLLWSARRVR